MTEKEFLEDLKPSFNYRENLAKKIKSHNLPVIIFGAAEMAKQVTEELKKFGVEVSGYAVDEKYFKPDKTYLGLPIFNFDELRRTPEKYVFVLGIGNKSDPSGKRALDFKNDSAITKYTILEVYTSWIDYSFIEKNQISFFETYKLLSDDLSKKTMKAYLKAQLSDELSEIDALSQPNEYFNCLTSTVLSSGGVGFIDCGAYNGDTLEKFINFVGGDYKKIFAFEFETENFEKLKNLVQEKNYKNVELLNCGVWNEKKVLTFTRVAGSGNSKISNDGEVIAKVDTIDNIVGEEKIDFIKMDIEGSELNALKGAKKTLERCKPALAISVYHKKEDLITIPQFLKEIYKGSRFYLRQHYNGPIYLLCDLDLYVIP